VDQPFRLFKVLGVETLGEPAVDRREEITGCGLTTLVAAEPGKARGGT